MRPSLIIATLLSAMGAWAADKPVATFTENKGQWPENVLYRCLVPGGALFVEKNAFTFALTTGGPHHHHGPEEADPSDPVRSHAYRVTFEGASTPYPEGETTQPGYSNFFIGNDPAHWGTHCSVHGEVYLRGLYPGIDLHIDGRKGLKYEFIVAPGADPALIRMRYDGPDKLTLSDGEMLVKTSAGTVTEGVPQAFRELREGTLCSMRLTRVPVECVYRLRENRVSFAVEPQDQVLVIDPELTFGSFSGSTADNFGFTATYDDDGNLYGGGIAFGTGYPTTLGAFQETFVGDFQDIALTKFSPDGSSLIWSTYLGGAFSSETPHSLVVNSDDELFVLAVTGSADFPTTSGCYDPGFNGGVEIPYSGGLVNYNNTEGYDFGSGTDIAIIHFSADATSLIGSTFIGGTNNDGLNQSSPLVHNYGDHFRGEIALNTDGDPVIATSTQSLDAPVSAGAPQPSFGGGVLDGYLFSLDADLTDLRFATYYGGSEDDSGYGVQFASNGEIFLTGGTTSGDLPMSGSPSDDTYNGSTDGYIARFSADGNLRLATTFVGTADYDQSYFVQLNTADEVFIVGQTHGNYPITSGKYSIPGSSQFIHKFSQDLSTSVWSTRIGNGSGVEDIAPSAFLVSDCGQIYFSGWGGAVNSENIPSASGSTTQGLPVTPDAFQSSTDGDDFYLLVLQPEASSLNYATYFGGSISPEHVDGGTSRFDKKGNVYQAVCAGCEGFSDFPTTPGAWSTTNNSDNCNLAVFKFNLTMPVASIGIDGPSQVCAPALVQFTNASVGGTSYSWAFGDNGTSSLFAPAHLYTDTGTYSVSMLLSDSNGCSLSDTADIHVQVFNPDDSFLDPVDTVCLGTSVQLVASGGSEYNWSPTIFLSDSTIAAPTAEPTEDITYSVVITDVCGTDTLSVDITVMAPSGEACADAVICEGDTIPISATGGTAYAWSPGGSLSSTNSDSPLAFPALTTAYIVQVTNAAGCVQADTVTVTVQHGPPISVAEDVALCFGDSAQLNASGGDTYAWTPAPGLLGMTIPDPIASPSFPTWYYVLVTNACASVQDSVHVDVQHVVASAWPDTVLCPGESALVSAAGGAFYSWSPPAAFSAPNAAVTLCTPTGTSTYTVVVSSPLGCSDTATIAIGLYPQPHVSAGYDHVIDYPGSAELMATGQGTLQWTPALSLDCDTCAAVVASPEITTTYTVQLTDSNGCRISDQVMVYVNGLLYVPNTFTPDGDGINDGFFALATNVKTYALCVFNRWGEQIYAADRPERSWDGSYQGIPSPIDTYVWRIDITELTGKKRTVFGHVNLVR